MADEVLRVRPGRPPVGRLTPPGDKSISHRAVMLAALASGESRVRGWLDAGDTRATLEAMEAMGVPITVDRRGPGAADLTVQGVGLRGLGPPGRPLHCHRSGTTMRLLAGLLAGQPFSSLLDGDPQLRRRPMRRVTLPLRQMGAEIYDEEGHAPLRIRGGPLQGITYTMPVASAQVKSALLLAGLYADGPTIVHQPGPSRDHTERMLAAMGVEVRVAGLTVTLYPPTAPLAPLDLTVPGDFSSAAFPLVAALLVPGSRLLLKGVNLNPTRTGLLEVLREMGAEVVERAVRQEGGEPVADLEVRPSPLRATTVAGERVVRMIDEFPIFAVAATQAVGETVVRDAAELRVKEVDRIAVLVQELGKMGAVIRERPDGFVVQGATPLRGAVVDSHGDHRLAMALGVAGLLAEGETVVLGAEAIGDSYPGFVEAMQALGAGMEKSQEED